MGARPAAIAVKPATKHSHINLYYCNAAKYYDSIKELLILSLICPDSHKKK